MKKKTTEIIKYLQSYHEDQFNSPYQSTIDFLEWLESLHFINDAGGKILDVGCGMGANIFYMAQRYPNFSFVGLEHNPELIKKGKQEFDKRFLKNSRLIEGDLYSLNEYFSLGAFDGILSFQTLSWLDNYEKAIKEIVSLQPKFIALSSLFYDGRIEAMTTITEYAESGEEIKIPYNTYSIDKVRTLFKCHGYDNFDYIPFDISIDLNQQCKHRMGTYTETLNSGKRLQFSGPLLMNWHFICASKTN